ncbi:MAG: aspartate--tRNA ligase [Oscillospiraceae bacterium]|jgi:aspartyl-tRNA synthetase|nr:aspartate--tRNA ligase [Oscillospiraceae bacterium]
MDNLLNFKRTAYCGAPRAADIGAEYTVMGWVQRRRDLGQLLFIDLRDRTGILQLAFDENTDRAVFDKATALRSEYVIAARGVLRERSSKNPELPTGEVELEVTELRVLSEAETTPFEILDKTNVNEELRLRYRYLDLRRPTLQKNLMTRHEIARVTREYFYENGFLELETPMLIKSTPEGARDYVVPSRVHNGRFYALPQSPQIYKQLLMLSGFDRYVQLARCFRDEDLRADRQPEFTQVDVEMSFVDVDDILEMIEGYIARLMREVSGINIPMPLPRLSYAEAMNRFGSDKPDARFGMELLDLSAVVANSGFAVFDGALTSGGSVRAINAKNAASVLTRKEIDKLTETAKGVGAKGLAYARWVEADDAPNVSFAKFVSPETLAAIYAATEFERGDVLLIIADKNGVTLPVLGQLRNIVAKKLDIIPDGFSYLWVTEFPFFERDDDTGEWVAMHHPFTMPTEDSLPYVESDPGRVLAKCYDLVVNGTELCSGSIRINDYKLQDRMFKALGLTREQIDAKFGFLVEAYKYGAPPHGGVGIGLDRLAMVLCGADSLRDVTAFPKLQNASEPMSGAPGDVDASQLAELGIQFTINN